MNANDIKPDDHDSALDELEFIEVDPDLPENKPFYKRCAHPFESLILKKSTARAWSFDEGRFTAQQPTAHFVCADCSQVLTISSPEVVG